MREIVELDGTDLDELSKLFYVYIREALNVTYNPYYDTGHNL